MKVGDMIEHTRTGNIALLTQLWLSGPNRYIVEAVHNAQLVRWFRSSVKKLDSSPRRTR